MTHKQYNEMVAHIESSEDIDREQDFMLFLLRKIRRSIQLEYSYDAWYDINELIKQVEKRAHVEWEKK